MKMIIDLTRGGLLAELNAFDILVATQLTYENAKKLYGDLSINLPLDIFRSEPYTKELVYKDYQHEIWQNFTEYQDKYNKKLLEKVRNPNDFMYVLLSTAIKFSLEKMTAAWHAAIGAPVEPLMPLEAIQKLAKDEYHLLANFN